MTETYRDAVFISTDSHVTEPITIYEQGVPAAYKQRVPKIVDNDGWRTIYVEGLDPRKLMPASELAEAVIGDVDAASRFADQERDGVRAEVIFPTFALQACFASDDVGLQAALCRAYNDWAMDVLGNEHRLLPVGLVSMLDVDAAIAEAQDLAGQGCRALFLPRARIRSAPTTTPSTTASGPSPKSSASPSPSTREPATSRGSCADPVVRSSTTCSAPSSTDRW